MLQKHELDQVKQDRLRVYTDQFALKQRYATICQFLRYVIIGNCFGINLTFILMIYDHVNGRYIYLSFPLSRLYTM